MKYVRVCDTCCLPLMSDVRTTLSRPGRNAVNRGRQTVPVRSRRQRADLGRERPNQIRANPVRLVGHSWDPRGDRSSNGVASPSRHIKRPTTRRSDRVGSVSVLIVRTHSRLRPVPFIASPCGLAVRLRLGLGLGPGLGLVIKRQLGLPCVDIRSAGPAGFQSGGRTPATDCSR